MMTTEQPQVDMVTLTIDDREVTVPKGTFVLYAAKKAGIEIPNFCQYPDLRPYGACRTCMVEIVTRRSSIDISCSTPVSDGMKVFTQTDRVREAQRFAVESLLVDHPIDCPICDKSGECDLQNHAYTTQVRIDNPLARPKMSWEYETLSESVMIKRDRCVLCGRCVRVCDEMVGATALAWARRGFASYIDAAFGADLTKSPCVSCGMCIEVCPVGALLNTSYHDTARAWMLKRVDSVCTFCGVGCNMQLNVEEETGRIKRILSDAEKGVNGQQLCARGFFGYEFVEQETRLTAPLVRRAGRLVETSWDEALSVIEARLPEYTDGSFAGVAGHHCTNEENYLFGRFVRGVMRTNNVDYDAGLGVGAPRGGLRDVFGSDAATNGFLDITENSRAVLILGTNLSATHPVFSYKLQTAVRRKGIKLIVASPKPTPLSRIADCTIEYKPGTEAALLNGLAAIIADRGLAADAYVADRVANFDEWREAARTYTPESVSAATGVPVETLQRAAVLYASGGAGEGGRGDDGLYPPSAVVYSQALTLRPGGEAIDHAAAALALLTGAVGRPGGGVNSLKTAANGQGVLDMGCAPFLLPGEAPIEDSEARARMEQIWSLDEPLSAQPGLGLGEMIEAAATGAVRAMYVMGSNPVASFGDSARAERALSNLEFLVVQDMFLTQTARLADVVLPACSWAEKDGTYTSAERRVQRLNKALQSRGESRPDGAILLQVFERMGCPLGNSSTDDVLGEIASAAPSYAGITRALLDRPNTVVTVRPGKVYRNPSIDEIARTGVHRPLDGADGAGTPVLYAEGFPAGKVRLVAAAFDPEPVEVDDDAYAASLDASLYQQGTNTMTGQCPTLTSLQANEAADSSLERGRGVGMLQGANLSLSGYSTGQLTDI